MPLCHGETAHLPLCADWQPDAPFHDLKCLQGRISINSLLGSWLFRSRPRCGIVTLFIMFAICTVSSAIERYQVLLPWLTTRMLVTSVAMKAVLRGPPDNQQRPRLGRFPANTPSMAMPLDRSRGSKNSSPPILVSSRGARRRHLRVWCRETSVRILIGFAHKPE